MSRKLKIANLVLAVMLFLFFVSELGMYFYDLGLPYFLLLLAFQIFQIIYSIKDFYKEGKVFWYIFSAFPSFYIFIYLLIDTLNHLSVILSFGGLVDIWKPILVTILYPVFYLIVVINKLLREVKEGHE